VSEKIGDGAKKRYDGKMPILSFRVKRDHYEKVNTIVSERSKWESGFNKQKYLYGLLKKELEGLDLL